jgi:hypothetical protein
MNSNKNTPNFQKNITEKDFSFLGESINLENFAKINFFTLEGKKGVQEWFIKSNEANLQIEKKKQLNFPDKISPIGNLNYGVFISKNEEKTCRIRKLIHDLKSNMLGSKNYESLIKIKKENLNEISYDRTQLIADKINLENNFDSLAIKFNKLNVKNKEFFRAKDKFSNNLTLNDPNLNSNYFSKKRCFAIVNSEKNLDELIYELENKFAYFKLENGILNEKIDYIDESIEINQMKKKVN